MSLAPPRGHISQSATVKYAIAILYSKWTTLISRLGRLLDAAFLHNMTISKIKKIACNADFVE
jgi:hypothetical protein